jgi:large subunit ribosomal protein L15
MLERLSPPDGARKKRMRIGRGEGSKGKTCGKGEKGQNKRSGGGVRPGFEGGQMPINRRLPKRGFSNYRFKTVYDVLNVRDLARFDADSKVDLDALIGAGLVRKGRNVKILGDGDLAVKLTVEAHKFTKSAVAKIEAAGGTVQTV